MEVSFVVRLQPNEPKQLIIFDVYENNAYEIEQELRRKYKDRLNLVVLIGSVRDTRRIDMVLKSSDLILYIMRQRTSMYH